MMLHSAHQDLEPVGKDAKCIFYDSACPGKPVVEPPFIMSQPPLAIRLLHIGPQTKGIITCVTKVC